MKLYQILKEKKLLVDKYQYIGMTQIQNLLIVESISLNYNFMFKLIYDQFRFFIMILYFQIFYIAYKYIHVTFFLFKYTTDVIDIYEIDGH